MTHDYLLLGHFTRDLLPSGSYTPGGTAMYAALTAHRLGMQVGIVSAQADTPVDWPAAIEIAFTDATTPPTFENRYTPEGRKQMLYTEAPPLQMSDIPVTWRTAGIVHLAPILGETPEAMVAAFPGSLIGVTPQGWMREWGPLPGLVRYRRWEPAPDVLQQIDALILSIEDVHGDEELVRQYAQHCPLVSLTRGALGSTLYLDGVPHSIPAHPVEEQDPTGAGDVFAAALLVGLHHGQSPFEAARFASYAAALRVSGVGTAAIPTIDAVEAGLR